MFGGKSKPEIDTRIGALIGAAHRRARALSAYHQADADVTRLRAELLDLVAGSQHEVSVHLAETTPAVPVADSVPRSADSDSHPESKKAGSRPA